VNSELRILIAGGGTGGHIFPAVAVARELVKRHGAKILMVGTPRGLESKLVPEAGFDLKLIEVGPLNSVSLATRIKTAVRLPGSIFQCKKILREFQPGAVLGVGGYASGPAMVAALWMKIPTMVYEPNAMPGMANRLVGKRVQAAAINFAASTKWFRNAEVTGVPVRPEFFQVKAAGGSPHLLIFGGSQGARILNEHMPRVIQPLLQAVPGLTVLHQSGFRHAETTEAAYRAS
jgi:UDP-N-acetylglucosamine--N-acetylmuramyl-(pentapeptide) pyrophosphoryl-undecaprenol N-acetylglucosamine transferase